MIVVALSGGLGNQLFQYATGLALANIQNTEVICYQKPLSQRSIKKGISERQLGIDYFFPEIRLLPWRFSRRIRLRHHRKLLSIPSRVRVNTGTPTVDSDYLWPSLRHVVLEDPNSPGNYDASLSQLAGKNAHLVGFWQSPRYFSSYQDLFHERILGTPALSEREHFLRQKLAEENPVALHVRRGDYAGSRRVRQKHGLLTTEYFNRAIKRVTGMTGKRAVWVFSDDIEFCRRSLCLPPGLSVRFVSAEHDGLDEKAQLSLMARAQAFIISNSTFGWWAAWSSKAEQVYFPRPWTRENPRRFADIAPEYWLSLSADFVDPSASMTLEGTYGLAPQG